MGWGDRKFTSYQGHLQIKIFYIQVLLHTYMDALREEEDREINHHGKPISINGEDHDDTQNNSFNSKDELFHKIENMKIISMENEKSSGKKHKKKKEDKEAPNYANMVSRNEKDLVNARRNFYNEAKVNEKHLKIGDFLGK